MALLVFISLHYLFKLVLQTRIFSPFPQLGPTSVSPLFPYNRQLTPSFTLSNKRTTRGVKAGLFASQVPRPSPMHNPAPRQLHFNDFIQPFSGAIASSRQAPFAVRRRCPNPGPLLFFIAPLPGVLPNLTAC